jgi:hypothetical protein
MNVEVFKIKIQKNLFWVLVLIKHVWTWIIVTSKVVNFVITKLKTLFIKEFWWEKNWDDVNWLSTLKKHSQFESCEIFKLKIYYH